MAPEIWYGVGAALLLAALIYAVIRAGRLTPRQRQWTDTATVAMQQREESEQRRAP